MWKTKPILTYDLLLFSILSHSIMVHFLNTDHILLNWFYEPTYHGLQFENPIKAWLPQILETGYYSVFSGLLCKDEEGLVIILWGPQSSGRILGEEHQEPRGGGGESLWWEISGMAPREMGQLGRTLKDNTKLNRKQSSRQEVGQQRGEE